MRFPSENFLRRFLTFHSTSAGGFLEPPPKYMSYSIFSRRSWSSSRLSSSSIAKVAAPFQGRARSREHLGGIYHRPSGRSYVLKVQSGNPHCGTLPAAHAPDKAGVPHCRIFSCLWANLGGGVSSSLRIASKKRY